MARMLGVIEPTETETLLGEVGRILQVTSPFTKGEDVRKVQLVVGSAPDGVYGPKTELAVKSFQEDNNLSVTGMVGPSTWKAINKAHESSVIRVNSMATAIQSTWNHFSPTEKWMYGIGGSALLIGAGIAIYRKMN